MKKLLAAALCMAIAACAMGGGKRAAMVSPAPGQTAPSSTGGAADMASPKQQLDYLYAQVEKDREADQLAEPQVSGAGVSAVPMSQQSFPTKASDATCKPAPTDTCKTSCDLSDSICGNAEKICKLSADLQPDDDAAAKCTKATDTCKTAHTKCCGCM